MLVDMRSSAAGVVKGPARVSGSALTAVKSCARTNECSAECALLARADPVDDQRPLVDWAQSAVTAQSALLSPVPCDVLPLSVLAQLRTLVGLLTE